MKKNGIIWATSLYGTRRATTKTLVLSSNLGDVTLGSTLAQLRHQNQKSGRFGTDTNGGNTQMLQKRPTFLLYVCI